MTIMLIFIHTTFENDAIFGISGLFIKRAVKVVNIRGFRFTSGRDCDLFTSNVISSSLWDEHFPSSKHFLFTYLIGSKFEHFSDIFEDFYHL